MLLSLSRFVQQHRLMLWILLLVLTAVLLLFPVHLSYEYHAIESLFIFGGELPLFGALFYIWLGILLLLLFAGNNNHEWQSLALVCVFSLVFFGFWAINTPNGGHWDELWNMAHVKYLQQTGHIPSLHPNLSYFQFPALHLTAFSISEICGLDIFTTRTLFVVFSSALFAVFSYLLFMKLLKNSSLASLAVLLIVASLVTTQGFGPRYTPAMPFLILILALLAWREGAMTARGTPLTLIMIILLAVFTISYLVAPVHLIIILAGIYLLQSIAKKGTLAWPTITLCVVMFLAWEMYYATAFYGGLVSSLPVFLEGFIDPQEKLFSSYSGIVAGNVAEVIPLWARGTKFFWLAVTIGSGTVLAVWNLVRARKLGSIEVLETGGLLGILVLFVVSSLALTGNMSAGTRSLSYIPLFAIPIMLRFLSRFSTRSELSLPHTPVANSGENSNFNKHLKSIGNHDGWFRKHIITVLIVLFFVLSLPVFLIQYSRISTEAVYSYECSAGDFIESAYDDEELDLFSDIYMTMVYPYYVPEAHFRGMFVAATKETLLLDMNNLIDGFQNPVAGSAVFALSKRFRQPSHQPATVETTDPGWLEAINRLENNNKIYDNGHISLFER